RSWPRSRRSMNHSIMTALPGARAGFLVLSSCLPKCLVCRRRVIQKFQKEVAVPIRQRRPGFLVEAEVVFGNDPRLANAHFGVADLLDDNRCVGETFGKADAGLGIGQSRDGIHGAPGMFGTCFPP